MLHLLKHEDEPDEQTEALKDLMYMQLQELHQIADYQNPVVDNKLSTADIDDDPDDDINNKSPTTLTPAISLNTVTISAATISADSMQPSSHHSLFAFLKDSSTAIPHKRNDVSISDFELSVSL